MPLTETVSVSWWIWLVAALALVSVGAALFVVVPQQAGMHPEELSRIIQGLVTGIGFIGAGAILKHADQQEIQDLTEHRLV